MDVALVGYGYWGPNLARTIDASEVTRLAAVCDTSPSARQRAAKRFPMSQVTGDLDQVLGNEAIQAIMIALPIHLHHRVALAALECGKHVLVEKPLATTVHESDELVAAAEDRGLTLMVGHTFLFSGAVQAAKRYIDAGELGQTYYISMRRTNLGIVRSDANAMWSLAPHDVSILRYWTGREAVTVTATGAAHLQAGIEDVVFMTIAFEGGIVAHVHTSWLEPNKVRDCTIVGSRKMLVYDDVEPEAKIRLYDKGIERREMDGVPRSSLGRYEDFGRFQMIARAGDIVLPKLELREPLAEQISHFAACVSGEVEPLADGREGRAVVAILEAAQRSLESGGLPQAVEVAQHA
jgi:predicted dehydrogenase